MTDKQNTRDAVTADLIKETQIKKEMAERLHEAINVLVGALAEEIHQLQAQYKMMPPVLWAVVNDIQDDVYKRQRELWIIQKNWRDVVRREEREENE